MTQRPRSSKNALSGQRMRGSQSSKPRYTPGGLLPNGAPFPPEQESRFADPNYALSSIRSQYPSPGHAQESSWTHDRHENRPSGSASFAYPGLQGEFPPSYATSMEDYGQHPPSYTASMEDSSLCSSALPWPLNNADAAIYQPSLMMHDEFDMINDNVLFDSSSGSDLTPLTAEVDTLSGHQSSDAMSSFISNGSCFYGNLPVGAPAIPNNIHVLQRMAAESYLQQPWTHSQQSAGVAQQMPPTPPASDHGTPPNIQECFLPSQDSSQDAHDQHRYQLSQQGSQTSHATYGVTDITSHNQMHRSAFMQYDLKTCF